MAFHLTDRWGACVKAPTVEQMKSTLAQLVCNDVEHRSVSLTHESEWCLEAHFGGLLVWENLESDVEPGHLNTVSHDRVLELWILLSQGKIDHLHTLPWLPGYEGVHEG